VAPTVAVAAVLGLGGWRGAAGAVTAGELFAFLQYLGMLMAPVMVLAQVLGSLPQGLAAADRVAEVLATIPEIREPRGATPLSAGRGRVDFRDVRFGYRPGTPVLDGLDLTIEAGESVAVVGPSGSGKSTLALLVPRFYDAWS